MKTRKILKMILAAAVCLGMIVAAAACGKNSNDETTAPQTLPDASAPVTEAEEASSEATLPGTGESDLSSAESPEGTTEESLTETDPESSEETTEETTAALNGFVDEGGSTYYYKDGVMQTGFQTINGKRYYFQSNGEMLRNTTFGNYVIDANGVCTDSFNVITASNLEAYVDRLLDQNGRSLKAIFDYIWKNYQYKYAPRIGTLAGMTNTNRIDMICRILNNGYGPCTDFAYTLQYFLQRAGFEARVVTGEGISHNEHDWVLVKSAPGVWRHMDALYKSQYIYLYTDDQLEYLDGPAGMGEYRFRWDRSKWTSTTSTGTGGTTPQPTTAAPTQAHSHSYKESGRQINYRTTEEGSYIIHWDKVTYKCSCGASYTKEIENFREEKAAPTTQASTEAPTEAQTEATTEPESQTEATTQPPTEATTEAPTEPPTQPQPQTEAPTQPQPQTEAPAETTAEQSEEESQAGEP